MEEPKRIKPRSLSDYLEIMSKCVFQTGISWKVVEAKWTGTREAFKGFDPVVVAKFTIEELDDLLQDTRIVRNRRKVEAIVTNSQKLLALDKEFGGFKTYLRSFNSYAELARDLHKQFKFMGEMGCYYFLWVVGEKVPDWEEWHRQHMEKE